ncbi:MAG: PCRF domain-containing protein, partial [Zetaproteobacteria bacterium]|nr:PCRF domain-containing protein [Zetaproteobacteria bacterium]
MFEHLAEVEQKFIALEQSLMQGEMSSAELQKVTKERADLEPIVESYRLWVDIETALADAAEMCASDDAEMRELAEQESRELLKKQEELKQQLTILLLPKAPNDDRTVILEIRAGTGG